MNQVFNLSRWSCLMLRQLNLNTSSIKIALAAIACVTLVQAEQLDYAHILKVIVGSIVNDPISVNEYFTK